MRLDWGVYCGVICYFLFVGKFFFDKGARVWLVGLRVACGARREGGVLAGTAN